MSYKKKLIEVALPLDAINAASSREKSIRHGHPSTLHLWWARRPLAAARAVIFAQMVDDPSAHPCLFPTEEDQEKERQRLFKLIEDFVLWKNTTNEKVLQAARDEIMKSWQQTCAEHADHPQAAKLFNPKRLPAFHDPFAGGGALPLEAQRLGLQAYASDLNPVAVLINKAMIEIPPKFANMPPVNPESRKKSFGLDVWKSAQGLAEDVRYYGKWMRTEAEKRIGHLYPKVKITREMVKERPDLEPYEGKALTVIAWLWARTVNSPNPAFAGMQVPLVSNFMISTNSGKEAYLNPVIGNSIYQFKVKLGMPKDISEAKRGTKLSRGANFKCIMSGSPITGDYIKAEGQAGRMGTKLLAIVAEGDSERFYLSPTQEHEDEAFNVKPNWKPEQELQGKTRDQMPLYGMNTFAMLFTNRQLMALTTFSDLVHKVRDQVKQQALAVGSESATAYADALATYLSFSIDKCTDYWNSNATWMPRGTVGHLFARHAVPMTWDFPEANPFAEFHCAWHQAVEWISKSIELFPCNTNGLANQTDAASQSVSLHKIISTDPPYYDNISYADLSDFFYVWLRPSLKSIYPDLFTTVAVPKVEELVATLYRHGSKEKAEAFFLNGMTNAMHRLSEQAHPGYPVTIYYAFKQVENNEEEGTTNTGWDTFLAAVIEAGFAISGTWPIRTERGARSIGIGTNALASSIVLVCRKRPKASQTTSRREFNAVLKSELPKALTHLQRGNIAPVDLAQASIGPGMAVFTRYTKVLNTSGNPMTVREALALINQILDEALAEQEGDFDADSRWALAWFEQNGFSEGEYGIAETLSKAKNTSVSGMVSAGILASKGGKVRLLKPEELLSDWDPEKDKRQTDWEGVHHLIRELEVGGESAAAVLVNKLGVKAETAKELAYRLFSMCERKKRAKEALSYNALVQSWPEILKLADQSEKPKRHSDIPLPGQE